MARAGARLSDADYARLLAFRTGLRRFLHWSEERAADAGLSPAQHQLLLAVRGDDDPRGPTIGDVAEHLLLRHHSAVGLVDRAEDAGLVERRPDPDDHRVVRLRLTPLGARRLHALSAQHLEELARLGPRLQGLWSGIGDGGSGAGRGGSGAGPGGSGAGGSGGGGGEPDAGPSRPRGG